MKAAILTAPNARRLGDVPDPVAGDGARVREETGGLGADVVICAIGIPALATQAIGLAGHGGRVSLFAGFSKGELGQLDLNAIHYDELSVTGAFGLSRLDYAIALGVLASRRIDTSDMDHPPLSARPSRRGFRNGRRRRGDEDGDPRCLKSKTSTLRSSAAASTAAAPSATSAPRACAAC